ncbi:TRAP transporter large permease [Rhizobium halophytocola]|uniref:TRAP transporter large permease protein n=1 Tax=Rhizobium halophytocola TaxID=735519 RepID=A0ABS4DUC9_9HYPH|nr:TRAP transporter large permease [Rhizobium halophytocola]MBP1849275.1 tripartite ATP-independent transporter DctM subunit [Rhizobium halophytocola]
MSGSVLGLVVVFCLFGLLMLRMPVWLSLMLCGVIGNTIMSRFSVAAAVTGQNAFDTASNYSLSVIPLFMLMGEVATNSRLSAELFKAARIVLSGIPGGLAVATIGASGAFGAVCGSSVATAATMTRISLPEMREAGYDDGLAAASVAAGGSLGILIPPSIILVIYAAIAEQPLPELFAAAFVPGIVLMLLYIVVALFLSRKQQNLALADRSASFGERLLALKEPWQFLVLFICSIGGIYAGVFSPNEAAAVGAFGAIVLGALGRRLSWASLGRALKVSVVTSCVLFTIIIAATIFANFVVQTRLPDLLLSGAQALDLAPWAVMVLIILIYILMGCFLEGIGMVLITVPVFLPVVTSFGYSPIWFAIIVVIVVELGLIHPPVGMNLFIIQAQAPEIKIKQLYKAILPFLLAPFALILLLFLFPEIALWLPSVLY